MKKLKEVSINYIKKHIDERETKMYQDNEIDYLMLDAIKVLNEKGYKTHFCCSGHLTPELIFTKNSKYYDWKVPYIAFNYRVNKFMRKAPTGWSLDYDDLKGVKVCDRERMICLRVDFETFINATKNKNFYKWITLLYNNFYEWVNELQDVSKEIDYAKKTTKRLCSARLSQ